MTDLRADSVDSWLETVWDALHAYRHDCIPEGDENYDDQWSDITTAMQWITEQLCGETGCALEVVRQLIRGAAALGPDSGNELIRDAVRQLREMGLVDV